MTFDVIRVVGAREHNLKNITVEIPAISWWSSPVYPDPANPL
jgi:hypothetical protein